MGLNVGKMPESSIVAGSLRGLASLKEDTIRPSPPCLRVSVVRQERPRTRIAVLREAGGLGDVVSTLGAIRGLLDEHPRARVDFFGLGHYLPLLKGLDGVRTIEVSFKERAPRDVRDLRRKPYVLRRGRYDLVVHLFCPGFRREKKELSNGGVVSSRARAFCDEAGVRFRRPAVAISREERARAKGWMEARGLGHRPVFGIQPFSTSAQRNWPPERWMEIARAVEGLGLDVVVFHSSLAGDEKRRTLPVKEFPGVKVVAAEIRLLASLVACCDFLLGVDSGLLHLAGAVGVPGFFLFGPTACAATVEPYPLHAGADGEGCRRPCYMMPSGGYDREACSTCRRMDSVPAAEFLERALEHAGTVIGI